MTHAALTPVPFDRVTLNDTFWTPRMETVRTTTIPDLLEMSAGRIRNFDVVAGTDKGKLFLGNSPDSDLYKIMEAAAYTLARTDDPKLDKQLDAIIAKIAAAQAPDGFINTMYMLPRTHPAAPGENTRWVKRYGLGAEGKWKGAVKNWPRGIGQLYCAGHLLESAVAHWRATGKRTFLDVAIKLGDSIYAAFPPNKPLDFADHPQVEIGLIKLYQATGDKRYLDLATHITHKGHHSRPVDRGDGESHKPLRQQRKAYGHAVRTPYVYSGMTDVAAYTDDPPAREALDSLWHSIVDRRMYVTGGTGNGVGYEQHGEDYDLPNEHCYCECCSSIAQGQWNHRLNAVHGEGRYADLVEIEAYNAALAGLSLSGREYAYSNKLSAVATGRGDQWSGVRKRYLFCCPSKLPGFVAGVGRWFYATDASGITVNMYAASTAKITLGGKDVTLQQETQYPWNGRIAITVAPDESRTFDVRLRIPGWARNAPLPSPLYHFAEKPTARPTLTINGRPAEMPALVKGYATVRRQWKPGDVVELNLPMPIRRVYAHAKVEADRGRVALMRGPVVYCLEGIDNGGRALDIVLPKDAPLTAEHRADLLGGVTVILGRGLVRGTEPVALTAVPYYAWQNRGIGEMAVWVIEDAALCDALPQTTTGKVKLDPKNLATQARPGASHGQQYPNTLDAMRDGLVPKSSADKSQPRMSWWPHKGVLGRAQYTFDTPQTVSRIKVYWFQDAPKGGCKLPQAWRLFYRDGSAWKPVTNPSGFGLTKDAFNETTFDPIKTTGLRIEVDMHKGFSAGIHEWRVEAHRNTDG